MMNEFERAARDALIVPLDVPDEIAALKLMDTLGDTVGTYKVGLELLMSKGPLIVKTVAQMGARVFVDPKLHDIPNTVAQAARNIAQGPASMFTVHASGGDAMMRAACEGASRGAGDEGKTRRPKVLAVTVLTSLDAQALNWVGVPDLPSVQVGRLALLAKGAGVDGIVCSPLEIGVVREMVGPNLSVVVPGVRPTWAAANDQKRVATPAEAIQMGASYLVVGRPITAPPPDVGSPQDAARRVLNEMAETIERSGQA
jgi:orotidine-5'-phosphate decarboxylase